MRGFDISYPERSCWVDHELPSKNLIWTRKIINRDVPLCSSEEENRACRIVGEIRDIKMSVSFLGHSRINLCDL